MNSPGRFILPVLGLSFLAATAAAKSDLVTSAQRHKSLEQAMALARPVASGPLPADLKNPFVLSRDGKSTGASRLLGSDRQILEAVAPHIVPSGVVQVGDSPMLLLREKKLKVGDYLTITFEGTEYMVELASISHSSFTLRLNKEEITQPINP
ncbi:MAG TPA: hypothetical protein VNW30_05050 [Opitutaceae bacterium]|jgi:hypothetical protein|nr:hypothetical protein [Opitutaceae bacterium]